MSDLFSEAPFCPVPDRIVHSHWMSHIPFAFWVVRTLEPRLLVELGAYQGASFCAFCQQIDALKLDCQAYAVDTWRGDANMGEYDPGTYDDLNAYVGSRYGSFACLLRLPFDDAVGQFEDKSIDLLHIDGFHAKEAILHDFEKWLPKVSERGIVLLHDICARLPGYGGVDAWKELKAAYPGFEFTHGYGLGMLAPGGAVPEAIMALTRLSPGEASAARQKCHEQGRIYKALFDNEERRLLDARSARLREERQREEAERKEAALREEIAKLGALIEKERLEHEAERHKLSEAITEACQRAQAYSSSLSWKLTAPLRKLAAMCRS